MDERLKDRIAVITGASSGIGKAIAYRFARCGARIVCADLNTGETEEQIKKQYGTDRATFVKCDVTVESEIENLIRESVRFGGRVDIMCNFAGVIIGSGARCHEMETETFDKTVAINTRGVWLCCKYALKQMLAQEPREPNHRGDRTRGWIVNAASIYGLTATGNCSHYVACKLCHDNSRDQISDEDLMLMLPFN